jgi:phage-related protein
LNFAENTINTFIGAINTAIGLINAIPGVNISKLSLLSIPRLAKGGIVDGATIAEIGEKGREAVLPLDNNTEWMDAFAEKILSKLDNTQNRSQQVEIILEVDRREFGRAVVDLGDSERQRRGVRIQARAVTTG